MVFVVVGLSVSFDTLLGHTSAVRFESFPTTLHSAAREHGAPYSTLHKSIKRCRVRSFGVFLSGYPSYIALYRRYTIVGR